MHPDSSAAACCSNGIPPPQLMKCFLKDICAEMQGLERRHRRAFTKRRRLLRLAESRHRPKRIELKCPCQFKKPIEIVRLEERQYTRTQQLAYPQVRKLLNLKEAVMKQFPNWRLAIINRTLRYSLHSLYSRLQNVQPPEKRIPIHKWDKKERATHMKYLKKLAKHKVPPPPPRIPKNAKPLTAMKRFKNLARPKSREEFEKRDWMITPEIRSYNPTERILKLAKPIIRDEDALFQPLPLQVPPNALRYKATPRIMELSTPTEKRAGDSDFKEYPFTISPNALKAKPKPRIIDLAEPKEFADTHTRPNPFGISPAALKAKASPRLIELAKPKGT